MKITFKFTAKSVDNLEKKYKTGIENLLSSLEMSNLAQFIERASVDEETQKVGVTNDRSFELLDEYLADGDKEDLLIDIMEGLQNGGFLSRKLDLQKIRDSLNEKTKNIDETIKEQLDSIN